MTEAQPVNFDPSTALRTAQHWAFHHANEAQDQYEQAEAIRSRAEETGIGGALADRAYARAERSRAMADTWATAARALAVAPGSQPATYDLTVQLDPKDIGKEVGRQIRDLRRGRPGSETI
jgi:hypothetical protein